MDPVDIPVLLHAGFCVLAFALGFIAGQQR